MSLQANKSFSKKSKHGKPIPNAQENEKCSGKLVPLSHKIQVLRDPSGDDIFKRYKFGKELGRGEFGITYQCVDNENGENVACKKISKSKLRTEIDVEDVRREVEIMRHLPKHPNIVSYKDVYEDKEAIYLVMELCEGGELFDRIIAKGHYTERAAALVTKTILQVVKVCHEHGVILRDLKPENFLYANDGENSAIKAIDFGLSTFFEPYLVKLSEALITWPLKYLGATMGRKLMYGVQVLFFTSCYAVFLHFGQKQKKGLHMR